MRDASTYDVNDSTSTNLRVRFMRGASRHRVIQPGESGALNRDHAGKGFVSTQGTLVCADREFR